MAKKEAKKKEDDHKCPHIAADGRQEENVPLQERLTMKANAAH